MEDGYVEKRLEEVRGGRAMTYERVQAFTRGELKEFFSVASLALHAGYVRWPLPKAMPPAEGGVN